MSSNSNTNVLAGERKESRNADAPLSKRKKRRDALEKNTMSLASDKKQKRIQVRQERLRCRCLQKGVGKSPEGEILSVENYRFGSFISYKGGGGEGKVPLKGPTKNTPPAVLQITGEKPPE